MSQHYPRSSGFDDKVDKAMVCGCVYTSEMDWHREGWTGDAMVQKHSDKVL